MADWIPGWDRVDLGPDGGSYDDTKHPKGCLHTTEGTTLAGAEAAYGRYPPHLGYDPRKRLRHQYIPLNRCSYAFRNSETDDEYIIQVEIVGFASQAHTWPNEIYANIAEDVMKPLEDLVGIPRQSLRFYRANEGVILASKKSPARLRPAALREYSGWMGHQHAPGVGDDGLLLPTGDEHWDPGGFLADVAFSFMPSNEEMDELIAEEIKRMMWAGGSVSGSVAEGTLIDNVREIQAMMWVGGGVEGTTDPSSLVGRVQRMENEVASQTAKLDAIMAHLGIDGGPVSGEPE